MGRLTALGGRVATLGPRVARQTDEEGHSRAETWRAWYGTAEWKRLRIRVFRRDDYTCQRPGCGALCIPGDREKPPIADHKVEHQGDRGLFFDDENVWTLCKPCHDGWKQRLERRQRSGA